MRDYVGGAWRDVTVQRDGTVLVDGARAGRVYGHPKFWSWASPGGVDGSRGHYFTKRDAATSCADAHLRRVLESHDSKQSTGEKS